MHRISYSIYSGCKKSLAEVNEDLTAHIEGRRADFDQKWIQHFLGWRISQFLNYLNSYLIINIKMKFFNSQLK